MVKQQRGVRGVARNKLLLKNVHAARFATAVKHTLTLLGPQILRGWSTFLKEAVPRFAGTRTSSGASKCSLDAVSSRNARNGALLLAARKSPK